jgi:hypothetical protein
MIRVRREAKDDLDELKQERKDIAAALKEEKAEQIVTKRVLDKFARSAASYMDSCLSFFPALEALPDIAMTDNLYTQLETLQNATEQALEAIRNARSIRA